MPFLWHLHICNSVLLWLAWLWFYNLKKNNNFHRSRFKDHHRHINSNEPNFQDFVSKQNCPENEFLWCLYRGGLQHSLWYLLSWTFVYCIWWREIITVMNIIRSKIESNSIYNLHESTWIITRPNIIHILISKNESNISFFPWVSAEVHF